jgi:hypothetical protein
MKLKSAGFFPLIASVIFYSSAWCEKLVEVVPPIIKLRVDASATSDSRGFARKGQRLIVNGENGLWYQIRLFNGDALWIPKEAVKVLESTDPTPVAAATPATPAAAAGSANVQHPAQPAHPPIQPVTPAPEAKQAAAALPTPQEGTLAAAATPSAVAAVPPAGAAPKPKKNFKPPRKDTWYSQFSHISEVESGKEISFFQVANNGAAVYSLATSASAVLLKAKRGDFFPLLEESGVWYKIALKDTIGWIEADKGSIVNAPSSGFFEEYQIIIITASVAVLVIVLILILFLRRRTWKKGQKADLFRALIFAKSSVSIQCIISNKTMSLEKYLDAIGFSVKTVHVLEGAQNIITKLQPEVVFIDWNITNDISGTIEILFTGYDEKKLPLAIFYNVPDLSEIPMIPVLLRAYHLGRSFSDHDISKLITPTMLSRTAQKTSTAAALEGDIAEGNLPEIMQFIETGKKTGCLLIETDSPLGMIYFSQGRIIHAAATNNVMGREAIASLLGLKQGQFKFLLNKEPKTSDLNLSTLEVLMEWSKTEDEAHRG